MGESRRSITVTNTVSTMNKGSLERGRILPSQYRREIMEAKQVTAQYGIVPVLQAHAPQVKDGGNFSWTSHLNML